MGLDVGMGYANTSKNGALFTSTNQKGRRVEPFCYRKGAHHSGDLEVLRSSDKV